MSAGRYLLLSAGLFLLLAHHASNDAWAGDYWLHAATVREVAESPFHPRNPVFGNDYPFSLLSPYLWALGLFVRWTGWSAGEVLAAQGLANLVLLLGALYAFVATWLRRTSAAFYVLLFVLFLWGRNPWSFSSFFHLRSLSLVLPYPSTFAAALALAGLAAFRRLGDSGRLGLIPLGVPLVALLLVVHPVNALFLVLGLFACAQDVPRPLRAVAVLILTLALSVGLAFAWPLLPVSELWFGQTRQVHDGNFQMYEEPLARIAPALLGVPWLLVRLRRNRRDPVAWLCAALGALVVYGGWSGEFNYGRLLSHATLMLQVSLADACAALEERLSRAGRLRLPRLLLAPALAGSLLAGSWSTAVRPILEESGRGDPRWLAFLEAYVGHYDVVMTDLDSCWHVSTFSGKVVAFPMPIPFVPDHAERMRAVERFFEPGLPAAERAALLERYRAGYVLLSKGSLGETWPLLAGELRPFGTVVYADERYELIRLPGS